MRQPSAEQCKQLQQLRQYRHVMAYLEVMEEDITNMVINEANGDQIRIAQGALRLLRELKKHINT